VQQLNLPSVVMNYHRELLAWHIGKAGFTIKAQTHANLPAIVDVTQLVLKPDKLVKNVNVIIKHFTLSSYKKQNHLFDIETRILDYYPFDLFD